MQLPKHGRFLRVVSPAAGSYRGQEPRRAYRLQLPAAGEFRRVKVNGRTVKPVFDGQLRCPVVEVPSTDIRKEVKVEIFG